MTDIEECVITEFTRDQWLYVFDQVAVEGRKEANLIKMGERLIGVGLATAYEAEAWNKAISRPL